MKITLLKITISALAGFLVSALLVVVPGTLFMRPSRQEGPSQTVLALNMSVQERYWSAGLETPSLLQDLMWKGFLLSLAKNEVDCLPFLLLGASLGPLHMWLKGQQFANTKFRS